LIVQAKMEEGWRRGFLSFPRSGPYEVQRCQYWATPSPASATRQVYL